MTADSTSPKPPIRLRLSQLRPFHDILAKTLGAAGVSAQRLTHLFTDDLRAECAACAMKVAGRDILTVALAAAPLADYRLNQLRLGHCARKDCQSHSYLVQIEGDYPIDWNALGKILETMPQPVQAGAPVESVDPSIAWRLPSLVFPRRAVVATALVFGLIVVYLLLRPANSSLSHPFGVTKPKYRLDPSFVRPPPS